MAWKEGQVGGKDPSRIIRQIIIKSFHLLDFRVNST